MSRQINQQLIILLRTMYHVSPVIRYKLMMEFIKQLVNLNDWMSRQDSKEIAARLVYAHELDAIHDALYQKGLFSSKSLDELLINLLAFRMHDKEFTYIEDNEQMTPIGVYLAIAGSAPTLRISSIPTPPRSGPIRRRSTPTMAGIWWTSTRTRA